MEKFINVLKKYKFYIVLGLFVIFFFRSCTKSTKVTRGDIKINQQEQTIDSLKTVVDSLEQKVINVQLDLIDEFNDTISRMDRTNQMMKFHELLLDKKNSIK